MCWQSPAMTIMMFGLGYAQRPMLSGGATLPRKALQLISLLLIPPPPTRPQRIRLVQTRVRVTPAPKVLRELSPAQRDVGSVKGGERKEGGNGEDFARIHWRALSRRTDSKPRLRRGSRSIACSR